MHTSWTTPQSDNRALLSLDNNGLSWTISAPDKVTAVPVRRNGNFQILISVPAVRPKQCHTLSNPAHKQDYTVACLNYTLQTMMPCLADQLWLLNAYDNNNNSTSFHNNNSTVKVTFYSFTTPVLVLKASHYENLVCMCLTSTIPVAELRLSCSFFLASQTFTFGGSLTAGAAAVRSCVASASLAAAAALGLVDSH